VPGRTFSLAVSSLLVIITGIFIFIKFVIPSGHYFSFIDFISFWLLLILILIVDWGWITLLAFKHFRLSFGKFFKASKWPLFFIYYPAAMGIGRLLGIGREKLQNSFLDFQNSIFLSSLPAIRKSKLLLLLPHCLQFHDCKIRITRDISDCEECGRCNIGGLKKLAKSFALAVGIANGGTLARKIVSDSKPDIIIAVACHRDLTDGLRAFWKYPIYAILNQRPNGPCFDTKVCINDVKAILDRLN
jgi:uncharacterized protein